MARHKPVIRCFAADEAFHEHSLGELEANISGNDTMTIVDVMI